MSIGESLEEVVESPPCMHNQNSALRMRRSRQISTSRVRSSLELNHSWQHTFLHQTWSSEESVKSFKTVSGKAALNDRRSLEIGTRSCFQQKPFGRCDSSQTRC